MTTYNFGDIVLIGFPHTDLQGISKRPAVVLYDSGDRDVPVISADISSSLPRFLSSRRCSLRSGSGRIIDFQ